MVTKQCYFSKMTETKLEDFKGKQVAVVEEYVSENHLKKYHHDDPETLLAALNALLAHIRARKPLHIRKNSPMFLICLLRVSACIRFFSKRGKYGCTQKK